MYWNVFYILYFGSEWNIWIAAEKDRKAYEYNVIYHSNTYLCKCVIMRNVILIKKTENMKES
jgi:hypothetical protein